jgi:hypothetical protein
VRKKGGDRHYQLTYCPNTRDLDGRHSHECAVIVRANGTFAVQCRHDRDATWGDFKGLIDWADHARKVMRQLGVAPRSVPYLAADDGLYYLQRFRGRTVKTRLTNFAAQIVRAVALDDGVEVTYLFEVEARLDGTATRFTLTAAQFASMNWVLGRLGPRAVLFPGATKAHVRAAIQVLSGEVPTENVYTHIGWRRHGEEYVYLHAGCAIGGGGPVPGVQVDVPEPLTRYLLPEPSSGRALRAAIQASLRLLDVAADLVTVPLWAAIWRAPQELTQEIHGRTPLLPARPPHRHQHRLRPRPGRGAVAAPDLAQDDTEADGQLGPPVGGVQPRLAQEREQLVAMRPQVLGEALVGRVGLCGEDQVGKLALQAAAGHGQPVTVSGRPAGRWGPNDRREAQGSGDDGAALQVWVPLPLCHDGLCLPLNARGAKILVLVHLPLSSQFTKPIPSSRLPSVETASKPVSTLLNDLTYFDYCLCESRTPQCRTSKGGVFLRKRCGPGVGESEKHPILVTFDTATHPLPNIQMVKHL